MVHAKFAIPHLRQSFFLFIAHIGSAFISNFVSPYDFCRSVTSLKAITKSEVSYGVDFGSVHNLSCTVRFLILSMNISCTRLSVCAPKSHSAANTYSECQNCPSVSVCICFLDRNLKRFRVRFHLISNVSLQFVIRSWSDIFAIFAVGYLSVNVFLAAAPKKR